MGGRGREEFGDGDDFAVAPKGFEVIAAALFVGKEVDNKVEGIDDEPAAQGGGAEEALVAALGVQDFVEGGLEGAEVRVGGRGGDDEIIGDGRLGGEFKDPDIFGFFIVEGLAAKADQVEGGGLGISHERN
jgi:hypothetical protein